MQPMSHWKSSRELGWAGRGLLPCYLGFASYYANSIKKEIQSITCVFEKLPVTGDKTVSVSSRQYMLQN